MNTDDIGLDDIPKPDDPEDDATPIILERWKTRHKNWDQLASKMTEATKSVYAIVIGQCFDTVKDKVKTYNDLENIQPDLDLIELLRLIRTLIYSGTASKKTTLAYIEAELGLLDYK